MKQESEKNKKTYSYVYTRINMKWMDGINPYIYFFIFIK